MKRKHILEIIAGTGITALAAPLAAQSPSNARIGAATSEATGTVYYASDEGYFTKRGLNVTITAASGGAVVASAIIGGDLDMGETDIATLAIAHDRGLPFTIIAPAELDSAKSPTLACVVRDAGVKGGKDFNGKTMACNVSRGFGSLIASAWIDNNGGDSTTIKWIGMSFPSLAAAMQRGTIDGYIAPEPFVSAGLAAGGHMIVLEKNRIAPVFLQAGWFATREWIAKNASTAASVADALYEANAWANANRPAREVILAKYSGIALDVIQSSRLPGVYGTQLDPALIQPTIDVAAKYGYISRSFPAAEIIANLPRTRR